MHSIGSRISPAEGFNCSFLDDTLLIPGSLRIGFVRPVPVAPAVVALAPRRWQRIADGGRLLVVRLRSPDALGLRVAVQVAAWPVAALLGFFDAEGTLATVFSGAELNAAHGPFRSPLIQGESALVAIGLPLEYDPAATFMALPQMSHLVRWPFDNADTGASAGNRCRLDVTCYSDWERASRATALLVYTDETGGTGVCTGTLVRDGDPMTAVAYLITAANCAPDATRAGSIEAVWFHHAAHCGSRVGASAQTVSGGAELLQTDTLADISLLRLRRPAPAGAVSPDWSARVPEPGAPLVSVHQPKARRQAIAFGTLTGLVPCDEVPLCEGDGADEAEHYQRVAWERGGTDEGSSGAGLFLESGQLVGVLSGGFVDCEGTPGPDLFGRLDLAYRAGLWRWLGRR